MDAIDLVIALVIVMATLGALFAMMYDLED